jgi:glutamate-ammonia-ligase adenylyltransferase
MGSVGAYTRLLAKEAGLRRALLNLCASGELLTDMLTRHPEHFERLFSSRAASLASDPVGWRRRLREERRLSGDSAELSRRLEGLKVRETLATGLAYAVGEITLEKAMTDLARLATDLLHAFLGEHLREFLRPPTVGVLSLGTLSAGSMSFASDADLLFVHTAAAGAEIQMLAARAAGLLAPPGGPYSVDLRLRPEGRSAPPSVDLDYLRHYVSDRASPWEALAMARLQPLYGRRVVLTGAVEVIEEWLGSFKLNEETRASLRRVRRSQEEEVGSGPFFDVKRSPGAMADVEHLALGLTLDGWEPGKPRPAHVPSLLSLLRDDERLSPAEEEYLRDFYRRLRSVQVGLQLHYGRDTNRIPTDWGDALPSPALGGETAEALQREAVRVREIFNREFPD